MKGQLFSWIGNKVKMSVLTRFNQYSVRTLRDMIWHEKQIKVHMIKRKNKATPFADDMIIIKYPGTKRPPLDLWKFWHCFYQWYLLLSSSSPSFSGSFNRVLVDSTPFLPPLTSVLISKSYVAYILNNSM